MLNLYHALRSVIPTSRLLVGEVITVADGQAVIELPSGELISARGSAAIGAMVYVRDGLIEGEAPAMSVIEIEV